MRLLDNHLLPPERKLKLTHKFSTVCFPSRNLVFAGHSEVNSVHHDTVTCCCRWGRDAVCGVE